MCAALLPCQLGDVLGIFDDGAAVVAALVAGEYMAAQAIDDTDLALRRDERQRLLHEMMRDRVVDVGVEAVLGQRQKTRALLGERIAHQAALRIARPRSRVRDALDPIGELRVQVLDGGEAPRGKKRVT